MLIAQITDFHVTSGGRLAHGRVDTVTALEACVARLRALEPGPDLILATGDLVDRGMPEEYGLLRELLAPLDRPIFVIPGNHDERGALRAAFIQDGYLSHDGDFLHYVIEDWPLRIIALDTVVPGSGHGELDAARIAWLDERLAEKPERATIVIMHHPPFATGIAKMDALGLLSGAEALGAAIARHGRVEALLCGHVHRAIQRHWYGTLASCAPSTAYQLTLDLGAASDLTFMLEPPGFQLHRWGDGEGLISYAAAIGAFAGPFAFDAPE